MNGHSRELAGRRPDLTTSRRKLLIAGAFGLAAATAFALKPRHHMAPAGSSDIASLVPGRFGGWSFVTASGFVLPPSDQLRDEIYSQLLTRAYINQHGAQIMLLIAYNPLQDGFVQIHRPEVCYPASGYQITRSTKHITRLTAGVNVPSRYLEAENSVRREKVLYWTRTGDAFPRNWAEQRWAIFDQNLDGLIPDGLLIRISSADDDADLGLLDRFASDLFDNVGPDMRRIMAWT